jgi:hypothetical protein
MACNSTFECAWCGNATIGPLGASYNLTPCFEATIILIIRTIATIFVFYQICHTCSLPSLHFLRSRVAFEKSRHRRYTKNHSVDGGTLSSIASSSVASALLANEDTTGAFKMQQPLLDDRLRGGENKRRKKTSIHQEATLARFPGVPAPRPGPLKRGDLQYLQKLRQSLEADKRDNEGSFPRIFAVILLLANILLSIILLSEESSLSTTSTVSSYGISTVLPPHVVSLALQCIVWFGSLVLIYTEWKKGVHTSFFLRSVWALMWVAMLVPTYDEIAVRLSSPSTNKSLPSSLIHIPPITSPSSQYSITTYNI